MRWCCLQYHMHMVSPHAFTRNASTPVCTLYMPRSCRLSKKKKRGMSAQKCPCPCLVCRARTAKTYPPNLPSFFSNTTFLVSCSCRPPFSRLRLRYSSGGRLFDSARHIHLVVGCHIPPVTLRMGRLRGVRGHTCGHDTDAHRRQPGWNCLVR